MRKKIRKNNKFRDKEKEPVRFEFPVKFKELEWEELGNRPSHKLEAWIRGHVRFDITESWIGPFRYFLSIRDQSDSNVYETMELTLETAKEKAQLYWEHYAQEHLASFLQEGAEV